MDNIAKELPQAFKGEQLKREQEILWNLREVTPDKLEQYVEQMYNNEKGYDPMYDDNYKGVK